MLLEHGADPNTSASPGLTNGGTPMVKAAQFSFVECCKALRSHGALLDVRDRHGRNALHYAARNGSLEARARARRSRNARPRARARALCPL